METDLFKDYNYEKKYYCSRVCECNHFSKLMYLIINKTNINIIKDYITKNPDEINKTNAKNYTALMIAARYSNTISNIGTVKLLLECGADINLKNNIGLTALMLASIYSNTDSNLDTVKILLEHGADINLQTRDGTTALMCAARNSNTYSNLETVKILLEHGADINLKTINGYTALMLASQYSNTDSSLDTVKILLEHGADINLKDNNRCTVLMYAVCYLNTTSSPDTVKILLHHGADINHKNNSDKRALIYAVANIKIDNNFDIIKLLLEYGADVTSHEEEILLEYINPESKFGIECKKIINQLKQAKILMNQVLPTIQIYSHELLYHPDSWRPILLSIKQNINKKSFCELKAEYTWMFDYLGINDEDTMQLKILDNYKYMD